MSTAIGVALFVIGLSALLLSVLMDRRPPSRERPAAERTHAPASGAPQEEAEVAVGEPDIPTEVQGLELEAEAAVPQPEPQPTAPAASAVPAAAPAGTSSPAARPAPEPTPASAEEKASAAEARLAKLRAELVGSPEPEPEPVAAAETSTRRDAGRVFAAVASVGRAPEETPPEPEPVAPTGLEPAAPALAIREGTETTEEPTAPAEVEEPPGTGHGHALPLVNHSDLVTHLRREHPDLESSGSTIQMRILHERAHTSSG